MKRGLPFGRALVLRLVTTGLPLLAVALTLALVPNVPLTAALGLTGAAAAIWIAGVLGVHRNAVQPLRTLASLLGGLRRGDYSMRSARARADDPLGLVMLEANACGVPVAALPSEATHAVIKEGVNGIVSADLADACARALKLDRAKVRTYALEFGWKKPTELFLQSLEVHPGDKPQKTAV